jgi:lipid-A-disaccharide synthase
MKSILWVAGENSGDLHSSMILKELNKRGKDYSSFGIGGFRMQSEGFKALYPFQKFNVMGFAEVIKDILFFAKVQRKLIKIFEENPPDLLILVDYPGFNLRLAKKAYEYNFPIIYYICPQFWAWKHKRVNQLKENTNFVACILPFEEELLNIHQIKSKYVGHPIAEEIKFNTNKDNFAEFFNLNTEKKWLGFFPGSRDMEIKRILPEYLESAKKFDEDKYEILISKSHTVNNKLFFEIINKSNLKNIKIIDGYNYDMMKLCDFLVITSGTATLEAAMIGTPFVIVYKTSPISFFIGSKIVKIKYIGLPNIIANKLIVPELIQKNANGEVIAEFIKKYLMNSSLYEKTTNELSRISHILGDKYASKEMADIIEEFLNER